MRLILIVSLCLLISLLLRVSILSPQVRKLPDNTKLSFESPVISSVRVKGSLQMFSVQPRGYERVFVTAPAVPRIYYGQKLKVSGTLKRRVLDTGRTINTIYFPSLEAVKEQGVMFEIRKRIIAAFERYLPPDSARLLLGISFGMKEPLSPAFADQVRVVGLLHVIAASGMNITLLAGALVAIFGRIFSRRVTVIVTLLSILFYAVFAGMEPSIVRASIMGSLALIAGLLGKQYFGLWALFLTGYGMLIIDPQLLSDAGFQLSFLATLGIILLKPLITFATPRTLLFLKEDFTTTLSAQAATLPILLSTFGQFSLISILVNVLLLWMVPPLMIMGGLAAILSLVIEWGAGIILYLCLPLLLLFEYITSLFAQRFFFVEVESFPAVLMIGYYLLLSILIWYLKRRAGSKKYE